MDKYNMIDMFDQLDVTLLEDLNLEKDFKRQQKIGTTMGQIKMVSIVVGICAVLTSVLALLMQLKRRKIQRSIIYKLRKI